MTTAIEERAASMSDMQLAIRKVHRKLFRAMDRGTGTRLSCEEVQWLAMTSLGEDEAIAADHLPPVREEV